MSKKTPFETQLILYSLISSLPLTILLLWVMIYSEISIWLILLTVFLSGILIIYTNYQIYQKSVYQYRSLTNLLDAMTRGDYSLRAHTDQTYGASDELVTSINALAGRLSLQRWESIESQLLVQTVIEHIDVAIVALDVNNQISFINPAAKKLLVHDQSKSNIDLLKQLAFVQSFSSGHHQVVELSLGYQQGRFNVHVEEFREAGIQKKLLFITDVRTLLRSEERKAWQSLVRVISHEINNSLSPIASISQTLSRLIQRRDVNEDINDTLIEGLTIIADRADGLRHFVDSYKQLAKLPEPQKKNISILSMLEKICFLFKKQTVKLNSITDCQLFIDPIQFEQVLINVFKNAVESMSKKNPTGVVSVEWTVTEPLFKMTICDEGSGISNPENLFVPFYSTKKRGSGIGLVLCRKIIEAHNGHLSITNNTNSIGCCVTIEIPSDSSSLYGYSGPTNPNTYLRYALSKE